MRIGLHRRLRQSHGATSAAWPRLAFRIAVPGVVAMILACGAGHAQGPTQAKAGLEVWQSSGCANCHGPFADGNRADDDSPTGANLRATRLDAAALKQTISCGRPGAEMPSFDEGAYSVRPCYGQPPGAAPDNLYPAPRKLSPSDIDAVVAYLQARIIGRGAISQEECLAYYDGAADLCDDYH